ncbi:Bug family tripartite tricarboxylate transporter substrate binding protein [Qaidamihabitans albus]|uniref:Bug family tripartite tricarboxylate transporter substrate binding protein n=1 Tax=Qaidamihabitans albus TaxID=2795733 RepID=UPI0018F26C49|nr:tripartite tricarboxylate transporter substrate binding protein [Qaidamihabitans albus]
MAHEMFSRKGTRSMGALVAVFALLTAACGSAGSGSDDASAGGAEDFPSKPITWIVPYEPGGGSDAQVRRLQPHVEEALGQKINVVYQTGGDGAVGWQQLVKAEPDGYTIGNVVIPNILVLDLEGGIGFKAQELSYLAWTETTPNALVVAKDSEFDNLEQLISRAKENPGDVTVAGVGNEGKTLIRQVAEAADIDITFVPVSGGVGGMIPQLVGGHVDAAFFGASHVLENPDTLRALAISGTDPSPALPGIPTFDSAGYKGILLQTSWGAAAPPGTPEPIVQKLNKALNEAVKATEEEMRKDALTPLHQTPAEAEAFVEKNLDTARDLVEQ